MRTTPSNPTTATVQAATLRRVVPSAAQAPKSLTNEQKTEILKSASEWMLADDSKHAKERLPIVSEVMKAISEGKAGCLLESPLDVPEDLAQALRQFGFELGELSRYNHDDYMTHQMAQLERCDQDIRNFERHHPTASVVLNVHRSSYKELYPKATPEQTLAALKDPDALTLAKLQQQRATILDEVDQQLAMKENNMI